MNIAKVFDQYENHWRLDLVFYHSYDRMLEIIYYASPRSKFQLHHAAGLGCETSCKVLKEQRFGILSQDTNCCRRRLLMKQRSSQSQ